LKPKLIIFPGFIGTRPSEGIMFNVYNVGKSTAKNCIAHLKVIFETQSITKIRNIRWTWSVYNSTISQSGEYLINSIIQSDSININPSEKVSLSHVMVSDLYGEPLVDNEKVPPIKFIVSMEVFSENTTISAEISITLNWNGSYIEPNNIIKEAIIGLELEKKLNSEKLEQLFKLRNKVFSKRWLSKLRKREY
jgi:hypothetical protein